MRNLVLTKKKNPLFVWGWDRKICPSRLPIIITWHALWCQLVILWTELMDTYITTYMLVLDWYKPCIEIDNHYIVVCIFRKSKEGTDQESYNQLPHLIQDTIWETNKNTRKHHTQERQEVSPLPAADRKAATNRQDNIIKTNVQTKGIHKNSLWMVS